MFDFSSIISSSIFVLLFKFQVFCQFRRYLLANQAALIKINDNDTSNNRESITFHYIQCHLDLKILLKN